MTRILALVALLCILHSGWAVEHSVAGLREQIGSMIEELSSDENDVLRGFFEKYIFPKGFEVDKAMTDEVLTAFKANQRARLLAALKGVMDKTPAVSNDRQQFIFTIEETATSTPAGQLGFTYEAERKVFRIKN